MTMERRSVWNYPLLQVGSVPDCVSVRAFFFFFFFFLMLRYLFWILLLLLIVYDASRC